MADSLFRSGTPSQGDPSSALPSIWQQKSRPSVSQPALTGWSIGAEYSGLGTNPSTQRLEQRCSQLRLNNQTLQNQQKLDKERNEAVIYELRKQLEHQKELNEKQQDTIKGLNRSLKDYQHSERLQQRAAARSGSTLESTNHMLQRKVQELEQTQKRALDAAAKQYDKLKRERQALTMALATVAAQALGGSEGSSEEAAADVEAALSEGSEPLPRNASVWSALRYELDSRGNLCSFSNQPGTFAKPYDNDGARAVAALAAQVSRLHKQRSVLKQQNKETVQHAAKLQSLLENIDRDFDVVTPVLSTMIHHCDLVLAHCQLPSVAHIEGYLHDSNPKKVSDRLQIVWLLLQHLCGALLSKQFTHSESSSSRPAPPSDSDIHRSLQSFQQVMYKQGGVPVLQDYEQLLGSVVASLPSRMASPLRSRGMSPGRHGPPRGQSRAAGSYPGRMRGLVASSQQPAAVQPASHAASGGHITVPTHAFDSAADARPTTAAVGAARPAAPAQQAEHAPGTVQPKGTATAATAAAAQPAVAEEASQSTVSSYKPEDDSGFLSSASDDEQPAAPAAAAEEAALAAAAESSVAASAEASEGTAEDAAAAAAVDEPPAEDQPEAEASEQHNAGEGAAAAGDESTAADDAAASPAEVAAVAEDAAAAGDAQPAAEEAAAGDELTDAADEDKSAAEQSEEAAAGANQPAAADADAEEPAAAEAAATGAAEDAGCDGSPTGDADLDAAFMGTTDDTSAAAASREACDGPTGDAELDAALMGTSDDAAAAEAAGTADATDTSMDAAPAADEAAAGRDSLTGDADLDAALMAADTAEPQPAAAMADGGQELDGGESDSMQAPDEEYEPI